VHVHKITHSKQDTSTKRGGQWSAQPATATHHAHRLRLWDAPPKNVVQPDWFPPRPALPLRRVDPEVLDRQQRLKLVALALKGLATAFHAIDDGDHAGHLEPEGFDSLNGQE
jgi:hypothetical protein